MTPKQADFRNKLIGERINEVMKSVGADTAMFAVVAANMPEPTTSAEASAQIDALKIGGDMRGYLKSQPELMAKVQGIFNRELPAKIIAASHYLPLDGAQQYVNRNGRYNRVLAVLRGENVN